MGRHKASTQTLVNCALEEHPRKEPRRVKSAQAGLYLVRPPVPAPMGSGALLRRCRVVLRLAAGASQASCSDVGSVSRLGLGSLGV